MVSIPTRDTPAGRSGCRKLLTTLFSATGSNRLDVVVSPAIGVGDVTPTYECTPVAPEGYLGLWRRGRRPDLRRPQIPGVRDVSGSHSAPAPMGCLGSGTIYSQDSPARAAKAEKVRPRLFTA